MAGLTDAEIANLLSGLLEPDESALSRHDGPVVLQIPSVGRLRESASEPVPAGALAQPPALRTNLQAVLEALRQERERLADSRRSAEIACIHRLKELEEDWERERAGACRRLAQAALQQARAQLQDEHAGQTRALRQMRAACQRERDELEAGREELEAARLELESEQAALSEQLRQFDRDRRQWEADCRRQRAHLEQERDALAREFQERQTAVERERQERQMLAEEEIGAFEARYCEKLAGIRRMLEAATKHRPVPFAAARTLEPDHFSGEIAGGDRR